MSGLFLCVLCKLSWEDGKRCLLTPDRVPVTDQSMISPNSKSVGTPKQGSPNDASQSCKDGVPLLLVNLHILYTLATSETTRPHEAQQKYMQLGGRHSEGVAGTSGEALRTLLTLSMKELRPW